MGKSKWDASKRKQALSDVDFAGVFNSTHIWTCELKLYRSPSIHGYMQRKP
ncbi:hypothetical protein H5410_057343 [Solanum commersonii]|uniref:Uncharacterized protein n=1 Tax=Solanum commersonii TaxID=4109 RepID=A0A9J5WMR9_SOLCO|nr:hypothetical protein H5410_057343 [Solanum commersonii]